MKIIIKKDKRALIYYNNTFYVVSESVAPITGIETLIFPANSEGNITNWTEVGGGSGLTLNEVLNNIESHFHSWKQ